MTDDFLAKEQREDEAFLRNIGEAPEQEITGLVSASGAGGSSLGSGPWCLVFHLAAWRDAAGTLHQDTLRVEVPVSKEELSRQMAAIGKYSIVSLRTRVAEHPSGRTQAYGPALPTIGVRDDELSEIAAKLQEPVVINDPVLGEFTLDRSISWFSGEATWAGAPVELHLSAGEPAGAEACLEVARALWDAQPAWTARITDHAAAELLEIKNGSWLDEGESPITPEEFKERMVLESVTVEADGSFEFSYDDGDLFWGHAIDVGGSLTEGPTHAGISG